VIPPDANPGFVAAMEDVIETYMEPRDPDRPLVCLDETSKQLIMETRAPIPAKPGQPARHDYEYERNGVANIFMVFAPLEGWRQVKSLPPRRRRAGGGHRPPRRRRLRAGAQGTVRRALS
jgi:hypothetical protein